MQITKLLYRRLKNIGNYENETVELTAEINYSDDIDSVYCALKEKAKDLLNCKKKKAAQDNDDLGDES